MTGMVGEGATAAAAAAAGMALATIPHPDMAGPLPLQGEVAEVVGVVEVAAAPQTTFSASVEFPSTPMRWTWSAFSAPWV